MTVTHNAYERKRSDLTYPRRDSSQWSKLTSGDVPSTCSIYGDTEDIEAFHIWLVMNSNRLFSSTVPIPAHLSVQASFDWRIANWGTPTEAEVISVERGNAEGFGWLDFTFTTAWNHPQEGLVAVSLCFPELTFVNRWECVQPSTGRRFSYEYAVVNGDVRDEGEFDKHVSAFGARWRVP